MTIHNAVSASITNSDASPRVSNTAGVGAAGEQVAAVDYVTVPASAAAGSIFQLVRVKSNFILQSLIFESEAQGAGKVQLGLYYADDNRDLSPSHYADKGTAISVALFSGDIDCASAVVPTDKCLMSIDKKQMPLWQAAGLTTDPGGKFDICATVHTTDVTTGTGKLGVRAVGIQP